MKDSDKNKQQLLDEITLLKEQIIQHQTAAKIFQAILDRAPILISAVDLQGNLILANQKCNVVENVCNKQFVGNNIHDLFPPKIATPMWQNNLLALSSNDLVESEELITHKDKSKHVYFTVKFPLSEANDVSFGVASLSYDITELRHSLELSITDKLTGLYSHRYFNMRFQGELFQANRNKQLFVLLMIDIDNFDSYLACYGKKRADDVTSAVAATLQSVCSRADDLCFRLSKDQMASIFTVTDFKEAQSSAEEIREYIESLSIEHQQAAPRNVITVSMGLGVFSHKDHYDQQQICQMTTSAMEKSMALGGNVICLADKSAKQ